MKRCSVVLLVCLLFPVAALAQGEDLTQTRRPNQWKVFNLEAEKNISNVQKPSALDGEGIQFTLGDTVDKWYSIYLLTIAGDITNRTITAVVTVETDPATKFFTRRHDQCLNDGDDVYVRLHFQKHDNGVTCPTCQYAVVNTDLWWSNKVAIKLSDLKTGGPLTITASTAVPGDWQAIGGETGATHPDEFAAMLTAKKYLGLAFGCGARWSRGVAVTGSGESVFKLLSYRIE